MPKPLPVVFDYEDHRAFLRDSYAARKERDPRFSYGRLARKAGIASRGHLRDILTGRRNLTPAYARGMARALSLAEEEVACFLLLVDLGQAGDETSRAAAGSALNRWLQHHRRRELSHAEVAALHGAWHHLPVLALTRHAEFRAEARWISRKMGGRLAPGEAAESLALLSRLQLVRLRGRKLVWSAAGGLRGVARFSPPSLDKPRIRLHQEATEQTRRGNEYGGSLYTIAILTREEAQAGMTAFLHALGDAVPRRQGEKRRGELCVLMADVFPIAR